MEATTEATTARKRINNKAKVTEPMAAKTSESKLSANCKDRNNCDVSYRAKENVQVKELPWNGNQAERRCHSVLEKDQGVEGKSGVLIPRS